MASGAFCRWTVLAQQRILGLLVMVEQDFFPVPFGVAGFALRPIVTLVFVVLGMARVTGHLQLVLVNIALVAGGTFSRWTVFAEQGILGFLVVIKQDFLPALFVMARFALRPKGALVLVVLGVAGSTSCLQLILV